MDTKIDVIVKTTLAIFWVLFDAIVLVAKFVACLAIVVAYLVLAFVISFVVVFIMEIEVRQ